MYTLKPLSPEGIPAALEKAERYRLLNEPWEACSICRDIIAVEPTNQHALVMLVLSLTSLFAEEGEEAVVEAQEFVARLSDPYERAYHDGVVCERRGKVLLATGEIGNGPAAYDWLTQAMEHYEAAERLSPPRDDAALLRWNTCARLIMEHRHVRPAPGPPSGEYPIPTIPGRG